MENATTAPSGDLIHDLRGDSFTLVLNYSQICILRDALLLVNAHAENGAGGWGEVEATTLFALQDLTSEEPGS